MIGALIASTFTALLLTSSCQAENFDNAWDTSSPSDYGALLREAHEALLLREETVLAQKVELLRSFRLHEIPTYEWRIFEAYLIAKDGNDQEALRRVEAFEDMLRIDSGVWSCASEEGRIRRGEHTRSSRLAYREMCGEAFLPYYENPTFDTLSRIAEFWSISATVRESISMSD